VNATTHLQLVPRSNNAWSYTSTPPIRLHGLVLSLKHGDSFTFTFTTLHTVVNASDTNMKRISQFLVRFLVPHKWVVTV
jgi:hypothetical protein